MSGTILGSVNEVVNMIEENHYLHGAYLLRFVVGDMIGVQITVSVIDQKSEIQTSADIIRGSFKEQVEIYLDF